MPFDERKHPRHPRGSKEGGEFAPSDFGHLPAARSQPGFRTQAGRSVKVVGTKGKLLVVEDVNTGERMTMSRTEQEHHLDATRREQGLSRPATISGRPTSYREPRAVPPAKPEQNFEEHSMLGQLEALVKGSTDDAALGAAVRAYFERMSALQKRYPGA